MHRQRVIHPGHNKCNFKKTKYAQWFEPIKYPKRVTRDDLAVSLAASTVDSYVENIIWYLKHHFGRRWDQVLGECYLFCVAKMLDSRLTKTKKPKQIILGNLAMHLRSQIRLQDGSHSFSKRSTHTESAFVREGFDRTNVLDVDSREQDPFEIALTNERAKIADILLSRLPPDDKMMVQRRLRGDRTDAIARDMRVSRTNVAHRTNAAVAALVTEAELEGIDDQVKTEGGRRFEQDGNSINRNPPRPDLDAIIVEKGPDDITVAFSAEEAGPADSVTITTPAANAKPIELRIAYSDGVIADETAHPGAKVTVARPDRAIVKIEAHSPAPMQRLRLNARDGFAEAAGMGQNDKLDKAFEARFGRLFENVEANRETIVADLAKIVAFVARGISCADRREMEQHEGDVYTHVLAIIPRYMAGGYLQGVPAYAWFRRCINHKFWEVTQRDLFKRKKTGSIMAIDENKITKERGDPMENVRASKEPPSFRIADEQAIVGIQELIDFKIRKLVTQFITSDSDSARFVIKAVMMAVQDIRRELTGTFKKVNTEGIQYTPTRRSHDLTTAEEPDFAESA